MRCINKLISVLLLLTIVSSMAMVVSAETVQPYTDVPEDAWYAEGVYSYLYYSNYMRGVGNGRFAPEETMTRAMMTTVLWRISPYGPRSNTTYPYDEAYFADLPDQTWYTQAVLWGRHFGVVNGYVLGEDRFFAPDQAVTREEAAVLLYRYATEIREGFLDTDARAELTRFADADSVSVWALDAMQWCVDKELFQGSSEGGRLLLNPQGTMTRAEAAVLLNRFCSYELTSIWS